MALLPTKDILHEHLYYQKGVLYWRINMRRRPAGSVAGHAPKGEKDYWVVGINKKIYRRSRLVWVYHHGDIPDGLVIDHINRNRQDDRIENLRLVTRRQNQRNLSNQSKYGVGV